MVFVTERGGRRRMLAALGSFLLVAIGACAVAGAAAADPPVFAATPASLALPDLPASSIGYYYVVLTLDPGYTFNPAGSGNGHPEGAIASIEPEGEAGSRDCANTAPGQSCVVTVVWQGSWTGAPTSVTLTYSECAAGGVDCRTVEQPVTVGPQFSRMTQTFPASLDFGAVPIGTSVTRDVTVTLDPGYKVNNAAFFGDPEFTFDFGTCNTVTGGPCTSHVTFAPTAPGSHTAFLGYDECAGPLPSVTSCIENFAIPMPITGTGARAPTSISLSRLLPTGGTETATLSATLTHEPLPGRTVVFTIGTRTVCTTTTDHSGQARCHFSTADALRAVAVGQYQARFPGDVNYQTVVGRAGVLY